MLERLIIDNIGITLEKKGVFQRVFQGRGEAEEYNREAREGSSVPVPGTVKW